MAHLKINPSNTTGGDNEARGTTQARWILTEGKVAH